jgi:type II secretory pathway pseudopilin PulG
LLVVIAIIAILAAILFPVFAQAKIAAKKTQSLNNVKQLATSHMIYTSDYDDVFALAEYGSGDVHVTWCAAIYPYVKNGKTFKNPNTGILQNAGTDGIYRSPSFPVSANPNPTTWDEAQKGGFSYGVHHTVFADNFDVTPAEARSSMSQTQIDNVADKVMMMEKGANVTWSYPWFHPWQNQWIGSIATVAGDESTITRDGVDVYNPASPVYSPVYDTDCQAGVSEGAWECAAHARYRFSGTTPMVFLDGHAKSIKKGGIKWYQNIFIRRGDTSGPYWYLSGNVPY